MALLDCAINKKCCTVDGGRGICPLFSSPPRGICQLKSPHPREFAIQGKKNANSRGSARKNKGEKVSGSGLTFEDLQTVYSRLGNEGLIAILAQSPSSSPTIAILTSDHHGSNFNYNSQVLYFEENILC